MSFSNTVKQEISQAGYKTSKKGGFIKEAFILYGSISDPKKPYHLEFSCPDDAVAKKIVKNLLEQEIFAKKTYRKDKSVVYLKDGEMVSQVLRLMGANRALFELENSRIEKDVRQNVNRATNCETANLAKSAKASYKQVQDILFLKEQGLFATLPDNLLKIAECRLKYPEDSIAELGERLTPTVGKSGANHRLRKLSQIAKESLK